MIACYAYTDTTKRVCMALEQCVAQLWSPFSPLEALQGAGGSSTCARRCRGSSGLPLPRSRQRGLSHRCSLPCTSAASSFAPNSKPRNTRGNTSPGRSRPVLVKALQKCIASTLKTLKRGMSKITGNTVCVGFASLASRKEIHSYVVTENVFPHA